MAKPNPDLLKFLRTKRAWSPPGPPTVAGIKKLLRKHPDIVVLTCTRRGSSVINNCALRAFYPMFPPRAILPGDVESNPLNYHKDGKLKNVQQLVAMEFEVYIGMRVVFTRNVCKASDYVNGMMGVVEAFDSRYQIIRIRTDTGKLIACTPWTDRELGNMVYYPVKPGYASTILKMQGMELKKVCVYLDAMHVPGAAYTAISRVSLLDDFVIGGIINADHFMPAM